ncbi:MAG TPA: ATP-binding protein [Tepidisphaeraceae bacterium]|nr:ATP-binding protein [Tepidisphaeraceae bacterium]
MTLSTAILHRYAVLCMHSDAEALHELAESIWRVSGSTLEIVSCVDPDDAELELAELQERGTIVPIIFGSSITCLDRVCGMPNFRDSRSVLVAPEEYVGLGAERVDACLAMPISQEELRQCLSRELTAYVLKNIPEDVEYFGDLIDGAQLRRAHAECARTCRALTSHLRAMQRSFTASTDLSDDEAEQTMLNGIDRALQHPPRRKLPAGSVLLREDEPVEGIWIILEGDIHLTRQVNSQELVLDSRSTGPIVGLLALAQRHRAFFTARAATDVTAVFVRWDQLDQIMESDPSLSVHFVTVLVRSLMTRLRRIVELQVRVEELNSEVAAERDQLSQTLGRLEQAQTRLIEQEKMATLGQLAAKVAHELNNPIAAIHRAAEYIGEDVAVLLGWLPDVESVNMVINTALNETPISTRELRERREALEAAIGDEELARRLLKVGVTTVEEYNRVLVGLSGNELSRRLVLMERAYQLGVALRNIRSSSQRVTAIIRSLRSYARTDEEPVGNVDVHEGLEDTLRLFGAALHGVDVVRMFGELPRIECRMSELNQVWTNLISNAVEAMQNRGTLTIQTDVPDAEHVRIRITDSGPGIAVENLNRVFDLNFTTKRGQAQFGLGMGLVICRQIIARHGGMIMAESVPGRTCFSVVLPVRYPRPTSEDEPCVGPMDLDSAE